MRPVGDVGEKREMMLDRNEAVTPPRHHRVRRHPASILGARHPRAERKKDGNRQNEFSYSHIKKIFQATGGMKPNPTIMNRTARQK
jgi:hypothetical protein